MRNPCAIRNTQYDIRNTIYDFLFTFPFFYAIVFSQSEMCFTRPVLSAVAGYEIRNCLTGIAVLFRIAYIVLSMSLVEPCGVVFDLRFTV